MSVFPVLSNSPKSGKKTINLSVKNYGNVRIIPVNPSVF